MKFPLKLQPENPAHEDIICYAVDRMLFSEEGLEPQELRSLARDVVRTVAAACEAAGAKDVSHVKLYLEHATGFIHANAVSGNPEITVAGRDGKRTNRFRLVMNAVVYGLAEEALRKATEQALEAVQVQYGVAQVSAQGKNH